MNLLEETKNVLERHGLTMNDVEWVGSYDYTFPVEKFIELANVEYDNGYGTARVASDLLVCGKDWWLERGEYDGSEWWEYKVAPIKPTMELNVRKLVGDWGGYLEDMNE